MRASNTSHALRLIVAFALALALGAPAITRAGTLSIYIAGSTQTVGQYSSTTGVPINANLITGLDRPAGIALTGGTLYVLNSGNATVGLHNPATGVSTTAFILVGSSNPVALAVSGGYIYIANQGNGTVGKYNATTGVDVNPAFISGLSSPSALAVSGDGILYVASAGAGTIGAYFATTGTPFVALLITGLSSPCALALSGALLYVANAGSGTVGAYFAGTGAPFNATLIAGLSQPSALAVQGGSLFVAMKAANTVAKYIATTGAELNAALVTGVPGISGLAVTPLPPVITSGLKTTGAGGVRFHYQITASNNPTAFGAAGLPAGLALNAATGLISGTPDTDGTFVATIAASNLGGAGSARLSIILHPPPPPVITVPPGGAIATMGVAFAYEIKAKNSPASYDAAGLPPGLTIDPSAGVISGTPSQTGTFAAMISAMSTAGTGSAMLPLAVKYDFAKIRGSYQGLFSSGSGDVGLFTVSLTPGGGYAGDIAFADRRYPLSGTFSIDGTVNRVINAGPVTLDVSLSVSSAPPGISGAIDATTTDGSDSYSVETSVAGVFNARTLPAGLAGRYTAIIPGLSGTDPTLPHAPGYATMIVTRSGDLRLAGRLGDGTAFTAGSRLDADGQTWPLFVPLYTARARGSIAGMMTFENSPDSDCDGALEWIKPAVTGSQSSGAFSAGANLLAAKYAGPPLASGGGIVTLEGGSLAAPGITANFSISGGDHVAVSGTGGVSLSIAPATGAFGGRFRHPLTGRETPFGGVIYQKPAPGGLGQFPGTGQPGAVEMSQ